jgi:hypothetical protein
LMRQRVNHPTAYPPVFGFMFTHVSSHLRNSLSTINRPGIWKG